MTGRRFIFSAALSLLTAGVFAPYAVAAPIVVDIGDGGDGNSNSLTGTTTAGPIKYNSVWTGPTNNLSETDGTATNIDFLWVDYSHVAFITNSNLTTTGAAAAIFPNAAAQSYWGSNSGSMIFQFTNLVPGDLYDITLFSGHGLGNDSTDLSLVGTNTASGDLVAGSNASNVLTLTGISPTALGAITGTFSATAGSGSYYENAIQITQETATVPEPASLGLLGIGSLSLLVRRRRSM